MRHPIAKLGIGLVALAALLGGGAATAAAHIQVSPTVAAPEDAVRFDFLVPGEKTDAQTTKVALKVPAGVLPYSYADPPGWQRSSSKPPTTRSPRSSGPGAWRRTGSPSSRSSPRRRRSRGR